MRNFAGSVSFITAVTTTPDAAVMRAMARIAQFTRSRSANTLVNSAPTA